MTLSILPVDPHDPEHVAVARETASRASSCRPGNAGGYAPPPLDFRDHGTSDLVLICLNGVAFQAMMTVSDGDDAESSTLRLTWVEAGLTDAESFQALNALFNNACWNALGRRRPNVVFDVAGGEPVPANALRALGLEPVDGQEGTWVRPGDLKDWVSFTQPVGHGAWHVVVHNDEVTPMDVVADALRSRAGVCSSPAGGLMMRIHLEGRCTVRRHYFRWTALRTARSLQRFFERAGFQTRVELEHHPD